MVGSRSLRIISLLNRKMGLVSWGANGESSAFGDRPEANPPTPTPSRTWTYGARAVAAHAPLHHHALASVDHQDLMLDGNLVFGLDGMFELQHAENKREQREGTTQNAQSAGERSRLLRLDSKVSVKGQRAAVVDLEHIQLHVGSPRVQRLGPPCSLSHFSPGCRGRISTNVRMREPRIKLQGGSSLLCADVARCHRDCCYAITFKSH